MKSVTYITFLQRILGGKLLLTLSWTIYIYIYIQKKFNKTFHTCWYGRLILVSKKKVIPVVDLDEN